ncbi:ATP-binding cassette domain-containing protein [Aquibacillus koreensis]|uniref:ATP-binding cassette domain-containing protein n=1 Tax=Aquibacillus koreensis TaxID=279446 RepID=A0A9X3WNL1_9BACI|nr:ABC-F family ATP-binding cassette domain-containing protein [Aquibacillus koreensis]MCT2534946.1 ATP-binding cassette domain-containing protein [Aquibacillus koreensis]MDC3422160.1 ATP-binding cassette domain-containing protein [Aquibacillus koreensis]
MLVTLKDIKKIIGGNILFENLQLDIKPNEKIGLVGRNGSGKTTIFKIIAGIEQYEQGDLFLKRHTKIGYLEQIPHFPNGTVRSFLERSFEELNNLKQKMKELESEMQRTEKIERVLEMYGKIQTQFSDLGGYEMDAQLEKIADGLSISHLLQKSFEQLSGGEKTKAGLAKILLQQPELLLLDEPTNHLDLSAIEWLEEYLNHYKGSVCIISHDRTFLDHIVEKIADLENGEVDYYKGNYSSFEKQKEEKLLQEFAAFQEQQKKIKKMKEAIKRLRQWANEANPPNEGLHKRARNMERALERMEKLDRPVIDAKKMGLALTADDRSGNDVVKISGVTKQYQERGILKGIDLHVRYKERLAIVGDNGSGKSTLIKILMGKAEPSTGEITLGTQINIGYLAQNPLEGIAEDQPMIEYFRSEVSVTEGQARQILARFMFYGYAVFHKLGQLSGGEKMRLKLAIFMHQGVNVLLLDEPTNHLDVESQEVLEDALSRFDGTVIGISHDRYFLNKCFNETAYLVDGKLHRFHGTYHETKHNWERLKEDQTTLKKAPLAKNNIDTPDQINYEIEIERLEQELDDLTNQFKNGEISEQLYQIEEKERQRKLDRFYEEWATIEEK